MHDLRRQALESGKTVSRKAQSRETSRSNSRVQSTANSRVNSRASSRAASRQVSDEEDNESLSDETNWSATSLDDLGDNIEAENPNWAEELQEHIEDILNRKRSSIQGREESLSAYCRLSKYHYVEEEIRGHLHALLVAFSRSVKTESSIRETTLALRALELIAVSSNDGKIYQNIEPLLTRTIRDSSSTLIKAAAIYCLGTCTFFGGADEDSHLDQMNFFLEIISSDGQSIDAADDPACVIAALQEWGFLATEIDDLEGESEEAVEMFTDQLESVHSGVQVAAGENIALLYEKSYTPQEDDEDNEAGSEDDDSDLSGDFEGPKLVKRYNAYHNTPQLEHILQGLATVSSKRISKKDKKSLHSNFASILTTVENPRRGPMYNTAIDQDTHRHYGSKRTVKIGREGVMNIDRWWKWTRLAALRRILQGGFAEHYYQGNRAVLDTLPIIMRETPAAGFQMDKQGAKRAAKIRNVSRTLAREQF